MYYLTQRTANVRNLSVSAVNGLVSLIILLIAPLGLLAVIVNTALVVASTYGLLTASDRLIVYLQRDQRVEVLSRTKNISVESSRSDLDKS